MTQIGNLVLMQLRDKMDLSWIHSTRDTIRKVVLSVVKFVVVTLLFTGVLYITSLLKLFNHSDIAAIMTLILSVLMIMLIISNTIGLTESLYFSEDNKVLITMPVSNNKIFISKLLVFFIYEIKKSFSLTIPIVLGCMINISLQGYMSKWAFAWMILPIFFVIAVPVLLGALLSIPTLYIYRFVHRNAPAKIVLILIGLALYVLMFIGIISVIPESIDIRMAWPDMKNSIVHFLSIFELYNPLIKWVTRMFIGEMNEAMFFVINWWTVLKFGALILICIVLYVLCYYISRPLFFNMMSKNFEYNKNATATKKNKKHSSIGSFNLKEAIIAFRSADIMFNYLLTYVSVPIVLLVLTTLFMAFNKNTLGIHISYAFCILAILIPLLLSNSMTATLYSKEGRAGYIKKTKPANPLIFLTAKLTISIVMSIPCIIACVCIFSHYVDTCVAAKPDTYQVLGWGNGVLLFFTLILLNYGHLCYSAKLDITRPKNEDYATTGNDFNNPNEITSGIVGILISLIMFVYFVLFTMIDSRPVIGDINFVYKKMFIIALLIGGYLIVNYILSVKTLYGQSKEE